MLAIVLTFDRLPCAALGCYGNEWIDTPRFDRLAAEGFVFDAHVAQSLADANSKDAPDWWTALAAAGVHSTQIREVQASPLFQQAPWSEVMAIDGRDGADAAPREWPFAKLMQAGRDWLAARGPGPQLLWLQSAGIPQPCLVPPDVESLYVDEFADRGLDWPALSSEERARHPVVQAAYMSCLDHFFGEFVGALRADRSASPALIVVSARFGGRWQSIARRSGLPAEMEAQRLHSPSIWWTAPATEPRTILPGRSPAIVQPSDLGPTLLEWFEPSRAVAGEGRSLWPLFDGSAPRVRHAAFVDDAVIWTETDVTVFTDPSRDPTTIRRYLWPEDLWQVNDVAAQSPEIVAERVRMIEAQG